MTHALVLVRHRGNQRRLREWVETALGRTVTERVGDDARADLIVADTAGFMEQRETIERLRAESRPVLLPVLLVCSPREAARISVDVWRSADDVVVTPVRPDELRVRVERLMEQRGHTVSAEADRIELERSNVDLERFAFVAAHELVAPLAIVSGAVQTLTRFVEGTDATAVLDAAVEGCRRMQSLIEDILDLSRAGRGARTAPVDTALLVADVCDELRERLETFGATVHYDDLPVVAADPAQLRLVFRNLIGNAAKFTRPDVPARIDIEASRDDGAWRFCVADNGIGIGADDRERVFDLFQRGDARPTAPGAGIGLAICRRVVEQLHGRIWIEPREPSGTAFCFTIPGEPRPTGA